MTRVKTITVKKNKQDASQYVISFIQKVFSIILQHAKRILKHSKDTKMLPIFISLIN